MDFSSPPNNDFQLSPGCKMVLGEMESGEDLQLSVPLSDKSLAVTHSLLDADF